LSTILIELSGWCTLVQFDEVHAGDAVDLLQCITMHLLRHPPQSSLPGSFLMRWSQINKSTLPYIASMHFVKLVIAHMLSSI